MKNFLLVPSAIILVLISGCKKSGTTPTVPLLGQISHTGSRIDLTVFKYDSQGRMIEYSNDVGKYDAKFFYDSNDRISEQDYYQIGGVTTKYLYNYTNSTTINVSLTNTNPGGATTTGTNTYTLNNKQQTTKLDYGNGSYSLYTYDNDENFLTQSDYNTSSASSPSFQFNYSTYDQNKNPFVNVVGNFFTVIPASHLHNSNLETYTAYTTTPSAITTYTSTLEYNSDGYLTKETKVTKTSGSTNTTTDTYLYSYINK